MRMAKRFLVLLPLAAVAAWLSLGHPQTAGAAPLAESDVVKPIFDTVKLYLPASKGVASAGGGFGTTPTLPARGF